VVGRQAAPPLWDAARRLVDVRRKPGQFIFTGSTTPPRQATSHSGTGRFARLHLRTLSLAESGDSPVPAFLCIPTASGGVAQTRPNGVAVVPLDCLGA
jgi:hypothetical protein